MKTLKLVLCSFSLISILYSCKPKPADCSQFRDGTFKMIIEGKKTLVKRRGNSQLEYFDQTTKPTAFKVNWINACRYELRPSDDYLKKSPKMPKDIVLTVDIEGTTDSSYFINASYNYGNGKELKNEMIRIKED